MKRFQVVETRHGYAVADAKYDGKICTRTYTSIGWASRAAIKLNESVKYAKDYKDITSN